MKRGTYMYKHKKDYFMVYYNVKCANLMWKHAAINTKTWPHKYIWFHSLVYVFFDACFF